MCQSWPHAHTFRELWLLMPGCEWPPSARAIRAQSLFVCIAVAARAFHGEAGTSTRCVVVACAPTHGFLRSRTLPLGSHAYAADCHRREPFTGMSVRQSYRRAVVGWRPGFCLAFGTGCRATSESWLATLGHDRRFSVAVTLLSVPVCGFVGPRSS